MSNLVEHAKRELGRLGNDEDFNNCIIKAVEEFVKYGHSGGSAPVGIEILHDLLQFKNISPLTDDPDEWMDHGHNTWQNIRCGEAFSDDGGKTYYLLSDRDKYPSDRLPIYTSEPVEDVAEDVCSPMVSDEPYSGGFGEMAIEQTDRSIEYRKEVWIKAYSLVATLIDDHGPLKETRTGNAFNTMITHTPVEQCLDHIERVADWLLGKD